MTSRGNVRRIATVVFPGAAMLLVGGALSLGGGAVAGATDPAPTILSTCSFSALSSALSTAQNIDFGCSGTIAFPAPLVITAGQTISLSGSGQSVILSGSGKNQLFIVNGTLTLTDFTVTGGAVLGQNGVKGQDGATG